MCVEQQRPGYLLSAPIPTPTKRRHASRALSPRNLQLRFALVADKSTCTRAVLEVSGGIKSREGF